MRRSAWLSSVCLVIVTCPLARPSAMGAEGSRRARQAARGGFEEGLGIWTVDVATGEQKLLHPWVGQSAAVSRDLKRIATYGRSAADRPATETGEDPRKASRDSKQIRVGPVGGPLHTLWQAPQGVRMAAQDILYNIHWSSDGRRLFIHQGWSLVAVNLKGNSRLYGRAALSQFRDPRHPRPTDLFRLDFFRARWAGRSGGQLVVGSKDKELKLLTIATGAFKTLCPYPPGYTTMHGTFEVSDDVRTVVFLRGGFPRHGKGGVWVWKRGRGAPTHLTDGVALCGAMSRDGKYVVANVHQMNGQKPPGVVATHMWATASGKELWRRDEKTEPNWTSFAFHPGGTRLCVVAKKRLAVTPTERVEPRDLFTRQEFPGVAADIAWSADGRKIILRAYPRRSRMRIIGVR